MHCRCCREGEVWYELPLSPTINTYDDVMLTGLSYAAIAQKIGKSEQHVIDSAHLVSL